jgi:phage-related minor tail protein
MLQFLVVGWPETIYIGNSYFVNDPVSRYKFFAAMKDVRGPRQYDRTISLHRRISRTKSHIAALEELIGKMIARKEQPVCIQEIRDALALYKKRLVRLEREIEHTDRVYHEKPAGKVELIKRDDPRYRTFLVSPRHRKKRKKKCSR